MDADRTETAAPSHEAWEPWEARFRARRVGLPDWARDVPDRAVVVATTDQGVLELHSWQVGTDRPVQATSRPDGTMAGTITHDGAWLWWFDDDRGDERGVWRRQPFGTGPGATPAPDEPASLPLNPTPVTSSTPLTATGRAGTPNTASTVPAGDHGQAPQDATSAPNPAPLTSDHGQVAQDATGLPPAYSSGLALGETIALVGSTDEGYGVRVHVVPLDREHGPAPRLLYEHVEEAYVGDVSRDEQFVVLAHSEHGDSRHPALRVLRVDDGATVADLWDGPGKGLEPCGFSPRPGDPRLLVVHERDDIPALLIWDPTTGVETPVQVDAPGEVADADWWPDATAVLVTVDHEARTTLFRVNLDTGATLPVGPRTGTVTSSAVRDDGAVWASWSSAAEPSGVRAFHAGDTDGAVVLAAPGVRPPSSVPVQDLWVDGPGGRIHALLRLPEGTSSPVPLLVEVHGGPTHHDVDAFEAYASAWVDHGYAVVQVNYRGSTGYGSSWRDALEQRVGHVELEDVAAVRDHLVRTGVADPDRVALAGASWGGFLTLLGLGTLPDRWTVGLAGVPVADYVAAYEDEMEGLKAFDRSLFGGSPEQVPQAYADSSPITYVDQVRVPVLVLAGENDPRCPIRQIENYVARLAGRGVQHQVYRYDAGHGSLVNDERVRQMRIELTFAAEHLGTRAPRP